MRAFGVVDTRAYLETEIEIRDPSRDGALLFRGLVAVPVELAADDPQVMRIPVPRGFLHLTWQPDAERPGTRYLRARFATPKARHGKGEATARIERAEPAAWRPEPMAPSWGGVMLGDCAFHLNRY